MGAWGTAIYSDDIACDIRDDFRDLIGDGLTSEAATAKLLNDYAADILNDEDEWTVFWLSLSLVQWKTGRLLVEVKGKAIEIIDRGLGLKRWQDAGIKELKKRQDVLSKLREQLNMPQPPMKKVPKRFVTICELDIKDAVSYRLLSGKFIILKVIDFFKDKGGVSPIFEVYDWTGDELPSISQINKLKVVNKHEGKVIIGSATKTEYPKDRVMVIEKNTKTYTSKENGGCPFILLYHLFLLTSHYMLYFSLRGISICRNIS